MPTIVVHRSFFKRNVFSLPVTNANKVNMLPRANIIENLTSILIYNSGLTQIQSVTSNTIWVTMWMPQISEGEGIPIFYVGSPGVLCNNVWKIEWKHAGTLCEIKCHKVVTENIITETNRNFCHKVLMQICETNWRCFLFHWLQWYFVVVSLHDSALRDIVQGPFELQWKPEKKIFQVFPDHCTFYFPAINFYIFVNIQHHWEVLASLLNSLPAHSCM